MIKLVDLLTEACWKGYKQIGMKEKDGRPVPNCVPIKEENSEPTPYMYSPVGFSCNVCKFHYVKDGKHMCGNKQYQAYKGTAELTDDNGDLIKDPSKWCSNWFIPASK